MCGNKLIAINFLLLFGSCYSSFGQFIDTSNGTFGGVEYVLVTNPGLSWSAAVSACAQYGLVLSPAESAGEIQFLENLLLKTYTETPAFPSIMWLGGTEGAANSGDFTWIADGIPIDSCFWSPGKPDNPDNLKDCVQISIVDTTEPGIFIRGDAACSTISPFVCKEIPATSTTTTPTTTPSGGSTITTLTTTSQTTTAAAFTCTTEGRFPDLSSNTTYHVCAYQNGVLVDTISHCSSGTIYCSQYNQCYYSSYCPASTSITSITTAPTTLASTTQTAVQTTTAAFTCTSDGRFPDPISNITYHQCSYVNGVLVDTTYYCSTGTTYCPAYQQCYYPSYCPTSMSV